MTTDDSINTIRVGDATRLPVGNKTIHLSVTSPPYNVGIKYNKYYDLVPWKEYEEFTWKWMEEQLRILVSGGRLCVNVANIHRKPYTPLNAMILDIAKELGFIIRGEVIWDKGLEVARSKTSWGSWKDCSNPFFRDCHEYIEVLSKDTYNLDCEGYSPSDMTRAEFSDFTISKWKMLPMKLKWHPVPFPFDLPYRCIKLLSRKGMKVLDPFSGAGVTCFTALKLERNWIGIDMDNTYVKKSLEEFNGGFSSLWNVFYTSLQKYLLNVEKKLEKIKTTQKTFF